MGNKVNDNSKKKNGIGCLIIAIVVFAMFGSCTKMMSNSTDNNVEDDNTIPTTQITTLETSVAASDESVEETTLVDESDKNVTTINDITTILECEETTLEITDETTEEVADNIPMEYTNALVKAETYNEMMHMSKQAIYNQLISEYGEQFTPEEAQYAIENLDADYNANALEKAKSYSDDMHMSKMAIYEQLISEHGEQFTESEAQYAIDNLN